MRTVKVQTILQAMSDRDIVDNDIPIVLDDDIVIDDNDIIEWCRLLNAT